MPSKLPSNTGPVEEQQAAAERAALQSLQEYLAERGAELPEGIQASVHVRKNSSSPGAIDIYYFDQHHTRYRSKLQVARALGVADSKDRDEGASQPGSPRSPTVMGASLSNPLAADAAAQQPPSHHMQMPATASQEQGGVGASCEEEARVMATLSKYIAKLGGQLEPGWRCQVRKRAGPGNRVDTYFSSPAGDRFRSKTDVARHMGLAVAAAARRPAPASPGVDVNMAEEDVAAMLMALPHGTPLTARETARARKVLGADGEGGSGVGWAGRAQGPGTPDGGAAADRPSGLDSIAAALTEASPFQVNIRKVAAKRSDGGQAFYDSDEEETDARADEVAELAARQMRRLRAAAAAEGLALGNGWRVDVRIRKNGTSRGSTDYYYRLQGGGSFRSVTAAVKHLLLAEGRAPPPPASATALALPTAAVGTPVKGWQLPQQPERRTSSPPRPVSPEPAAPGSPGSQRAAQPGEAAKPAEGRAADSGGAKQPASGAAPRAALGSPKQPDLVNPPSEGAGVNAAPCKSNSGGVPVTVLPLLPGDSVGKGKRPAAAAKGPALSVATSAAAQPARTKAALAALGRDSPMPTDVPDVGMSHGAGEGGMKAETWPATAESCEPSPRKGATDGTGSAAEEGNAAGEPDAARNQSGARKRRRKPNTTAPAPKEEPAAVAAGPRSPQKRRAASRSRMDYATMHAMADLQYALSKEDRKANLRKRSTSKASTPGAAGTDSKSGAPDAAENAEMKGSGSGEEGEKKESKAPRKRRERIVTPYTKLVNRVRGLISRIRVEEAYLDAYEGEGWRGANREKLRPTAELEQARLQIEKCKLGMREAVKECEESSGDRAIAPEHIDEHGEIDEKEIFCGRCHDPESYEDNDIILCDGNCRRAYHEKCVEPPLDASTLPEDEGWLCPACDAKADILTMINEEYGFEYEQETPWHEVFAEAPMSPRAAADGAAAAPVTFKTLADFLAHADLPESDADDSSYRDESTSQGEEDDAQGGGSDKDGSGTGSGADSDMSESSSLESMASEEREGLQEEQSEGEGPSQRKRRLRSTAGEGPPAGKRRRGGADKDADMAPDVDADVDASEDGDEGVVLSGKRARTAVDYRKLNMEMFGDFESYEGEGHSDDDFTPRKADAEAAAMSP